MIIEIATWLMYFVSTYFAVFLLLVVLEKGIDKTSKNGNWRPLVSVAVPAYNEEDTIKETINSVLKLDYPKDKIEIIVVNDRSKDRTGEVLKEIVKENKDKKDLRIEVIEHEINKGKGAALNSALRVARGEIFICLDADSFVRRDALEKILPHFDGEEVASVLPFMKITRTNNLILKIQWVEYLMNFFLKKISGNIDCIHVTPGPFGCYRKKILESVGGFDENNLTEDLEMAVRLQKNNYKIKQLLDAEVVTVAPDSFKGFYKQRNRWYKGTLYNIYKHKDMLFNTKYGEFGVFHLPMVVGAALLSLSFAFLIVFYRLIRPVVTRFYDLSFIDFNFPLMIEVGAKRFSFLDFNYTMVYLTAMVSVFALIWIISSHIYSKENYLRKGFFPSVLFLVIYPIFLALIWLGVLFDLVRKKKQRW